jgi:hypothetical protein
VTNTQEKLELSVDQALSFRDCVDAASFAIRQDGSKIGVAVYDYVSGSPLWGKLQAKAEPRFLGRFIVTGLVLPLTYEFIRAERQSRQPDPLKLAAIWRLYALKCSEGSSEVSDATEADLRVWLPENQKQGPNKRRTVACSDCGKHFQVAMDSNLTRCFGCRYPGEKTGRKRQNGLSRAA